jgi:[acyl-carrier-protein] S-malonyltransferase
MDQVLRIPLAMAADSVELAANVRMGILFSRGPVIAENDVLRLVRQITAEGKGTIDISAILSPNSYLLLGQNKTVKRFKEVMHDRLPDPAHLRLNSNRWPPLHTPIVRQKNIPDRASVMMESLDGGFQPPCPPVFSMVNGRRSYDDFHARDVIRHWIDGPQRLWDAVCETLACGITTVIHVGPEPNVIPATFRRLADNITEQTAGSSFGSLGMRAAAGLARRPWLSAVLPSQVALLRAPQIKHVILEDWLLANAPR